MNDLFFESQGRAGHAHYEDHATGNGAYGKVQPEKYFVNGHGHGGVAIRRLPNAS